MRVLTCASAGLAAAAAPRATRKTFTSNRALQIEEGLLFEIAEPGGCGVDIDEPLLRATVERMYRERGKLSTVGPLE